MDEVLAAVIQLYLRFSINILEFIKVECNRMSVLKFIHTFIQQFHFLVGLLASNSELSFMTTILISFAFEMQSKFQLGLSLLHF